MVSAPNVLAMATLDDGSHPGNQIKSMLFLEAAVPPGFRYTEFLRGTFHL